MRKVNPLGICNDFQTEITGLQNFLSNSMEATSTSRNKTLLVELVFHRGCVAMESFISAWIIGAINRDSTQFLNQRTSAVTQSMNAKFSCWDVSHLRYLPPAHISVSDLEILLDPDGRNIAFKEYEKFETKCREWLAQGFTSKVINVPAERKKIIDAAKAIRNCIAHQSRSSFTEMNTILCNLPNTGVAGKLRTTVNSVTNVGAHLKANVDGKMRVTHYLEEFKLFAGDLA